MARGRCSGCEFGVGGVNQFATPATAESFTSNHIDCHRYPEIVQKHADDFCGEYEPKSVDQSTSKES